MDMVFYSTIYSKANIEIRLALHTYKGNHGITYRSLFSFFCSVATRWREYEDYAFSNLSGSFGHVEAREEIIRGFAVQERKLVRVGLKNCHYAMVVLDPETNEVTFGTPVAIPGAVNLSLDPEGDTEPFYADDMVYYTTTANNGYSGELELALLPDHFRKEILKESEDSNGVIAENAAVETERFALLFEFTGDKHRIRHCLYFCSVARPQIEGRTIEDSKEVQTETLDITATPLSNGLVKVKTGADTTQAVYDAWYDSVYVPVTEETDPEDESEQDP